MKKNFLYVYIAASLAMLVPVPGRFACGLIVVATLNIVMVLGTLFRHLVTMLGLDELQPVLVTALLVAVVVLIKQLLILFSPVLALMLGFSLYLTALSSYMVGFFFKRQLLPLKDDLRKNMMQSGMYSLFAVLFFLFRDMIGYGTISFPIPGGIYEVVLPVGPDSFAPAVFFASIPGALVLVALLLAMFAHIERKFSIIENMEAGVSEPSANQPAAAVRPEVRGGQTDDNN